MAKHDKLKLSIAKADRTTDFPVLKYSSTERGKTVDVTVADSDGLPYNLSGLNLYFVEELYNGQMIVDDGKEENAGRFVTNADDLKQGKFSYQFQEGVYQYDGWAHFKFMQNDTVIDTTAGFAIKIIDDIDSDLDEKSYVVYFENIKKEHQTALNSLRELISSAQALNDSNHSEISVIKGNITDLSNRLNDQVGSLGQRITDVNNALSGRIDTLNNEKNTLSGRVDTLNNEKDQLNTQVAQLTQDKNNLTEATNNLKNTDADLQSQINSKTSGTIITNYDVASKTPTKKTDRYNNKWLVDQNALGQFADQINQLKGRQTVDAPDFNTLTETGVYLITNPQNGKNFPSDNWGTLVVFKGNDGTRATQLFVADNGTGAYVRTNGWFYDGVSWANWNQMAWKSDITDLQNQISELQAKSPLNKEHL